jgi:RNA polymerase sigma factor (sigma-70 family)
VTNAFLIVPAKSRSESTSEVGDRELLDRFVATRDEAAFAELVQRHSGTVWSVCRRVLRREHDAEDAFQAVFVVLARNAATIRKREAVGSWLYGVAYRTAMRARRSAGRRHQYEQDRVEPQRDESPANEAALRELQEILDEEVQRLAEKYRAAFVLCCLEGLSKAEAARALSCKEGTVSGRATRARQLLQKRLARRGISVTCALAAAALGQGVVAAAAPSVLVHTTIQGALTGQAATALSPTALALADGIGRALAGTKLKTGLALLVMLLTFATGAAWAAHEFAAQVDLPAPELPAAPAADDFYYDFRGGKPLPPTFTLFGDDAVTVIQPEEEGLRVTLPVNRQRTDKAGVKLTSRLASDFEVTAGFEILQAERPTEGVGVGFSLFLDTEPSVREGLGLERLHHVQQGDVLSSFHMTPSKNGKRDFHKKWHPSVMRSGRLRIIRNAEQTTFWAAEGDAGEFERLPLDQRFAAATTTVWLAAYPGAAHNLVDLRIKDLRIRNLTAEGRLGPSRGATVPAMPSNATDAETPAPRHSRLWLRSGTVLLLLFALLSAAWLWVRHGRRTRNDSEGSSSPATAKAPLIVTCSNCGNSLRTRAELAGKKVKCPQCGLAVLVPDAQVGHSEPSPAAPLEKGRTPTGRLAVLSLCLLALVAVILWLTSAPSAGSVAVPSSQKESPREFFQSFKGRAKDWQRWDRCGPDSNECVRFEPDGVHITLPRGFPGDRPYTGLSTEIEVVGDFEMSVHFEFLPDAAGQGAGNQYARFTLDAVPIRPGGINLSRSFEKDGKQFFGAWYSLPDEVTGKDKSAWKGVPTQTMSGRLRLVRKGNVGSFYVAEESQDNFVLIQEYSWSSEPLKEIRLVGWTGGPEGSLKVRISDFRLRADKLPDL